VHFATNVPGAEEEKKKPPWLIQWRRRQQKTGLADEFE
jgi:hypothetical protein